VVRSNHGKPCHSLTFYVARSGSRDVMAANIKIEPPMGEATAFQYMQRIEEGLGVYGYATLHDRLIPSAVQSGREGRKIRDGERALSPRHV
jgi:hypothetical protein